MNKKTIANNNKQVTTVKPEKKEYIGGIVYLDTLAIEYVPAKPSIGAY